MRSSTRVRWACLRCVALLVLLMSIPLHSAAAAEAPSDISCQQSPTTLCIVTLRSGGVLVGTVGGVWPGDKLLLWLSEDEPRELRWAEIAKAVPADDLPLTKVVIPMAIRHSTDGSIITSVKVNGLRMGMTIEERSADRLWLPLCSWPCDSLQLPIEGDYRVTQPDGLRAGFVLPMAKRIRLEVHPGVRNRRNIGVALLALGGAVFAAGTITILAGVAQSESAAPRTPALAAGGILIMLSVPLLAIGGGVTVKGSLYVNAFQE